MSAELKARAREIIQQLDALYNSKRPGGGVHGQVIGMEPWTIRTTGDGLQCMYEAQYLLHELLDPFDRKESAPPAQGALPDALPKWIDAGKGKDPFTDDLIEYIEKLRAQQYTVSDAALAQECLQRVAEGYTHMDRCEDSFCSDCDANLDDKEPHKPDCLHVRAVAAIQAQAGEGAGNG